MYLVTDSCYECRGEPIALFHSEKDAKSLCFAYSWLHYEEVEEDELLSSTHAYNGYEAWFNNRADMALRKRSTLDCD